MALRRSLVVLTLLLGLFAVPIGCTQSEESFDQSCSADADCQGVVSCCDGCFAVRAGVSLDHCDATCVTEPCVERYGRLLEDLEAYCDQGICGLRPADGS